MFASFQNTSDGLTAVIERPKTSRSDAGCLPCRSKRKKCNGVKPVCYRCRNSHRRDVCIWPASPRGHKVGFRIGDVSRSGDVLASPSSLPSSSCDIAASMKFTGGLALSRLPDLPPTAVPETVTSISPELSFTAMLKMSLACQHRILCREDEVEGSLLLLGLPNSDDCSTLFHAWMATSLAVVAPPTPARTQQALLHHTYAIQGIRRTFQNSNVSSAWRRTAIIMLHVFEVVGLLPPTQFSICHLSAAHMLFDASLRTSLPSTVHDTLLLEGYILRTTLSSLVQEQKSLPFDHIRSMIQCLSKALHGLGRTLSWKHCPWIGPIGSATIDNMFVLSQMAHRLPLTPTEYSTVATIAKRLDAGPTPLWAECEPPEDIDQRRHMELCSRLYWYATALLSDLVLRGDTPPVNESASAHLQKGTDILDQLSQSDQMRTVLLWPVVVFGTAIHTHGQLSFLRIVTERVSDSYGISSCDRVMSLLEGVLQLRLSSPGGVSAKDLFRFVASQGVIL